MKQQCQRLEELTDTALKTMFSGTQELAVKSEQELAELRRHTVEFGQKMVSEFDSAKADHVSETTKLRDDVHVRSTGYTTKIEGMVKSGDFKVDWKGPPQTGAKIDKKDVATWKIPDGVSKPDFRH